MVPACAQGGISPNKLYLISCTEDVVAKVTGDIQTIFFAQGKVGLPAEVVEIETTVFQLGLRRQEGFRQHIDIAAARGDNERCFVFYDGAFKAQAAENGSNASASLHFFLISVFAAHIHNRRQTPAVIGPDSAFHQLNILYNIRIEDAEKAEKVAAVEYRCFV